MNWRKGVNADAQDVGLKPRRAGMHAPDTRLSISPLKRKVKYVE